LTNRRIDITALSIVRQSDISSFALQTSS